jgi:hypothetical protein
MAPTLFCDFWAKGSAKEKLVEYVLATDRNNFYPAYGLSKETPVKFRVALFLPS